eukprot:gnl/MRDRNA2_/MRDRNA2_24835_c0_seq1.p1 gnl/MRDRNA2_/MRDRNA2_24835_c0~~gnl/MRDRNA2_/MRDRNA2_24835_c0_seq1.p1  ORF type:complete len:325 (-),score=63.80 gnl/MRDRNA2_/MRDRNA2_24835_c0_seq1:428-1321(-)
MGQTLDTCEPVLKAACGLALALSKGQRAHDNNNASGTAPKYTGSQSHMIVIALDYPGTGNELTCTEDGDNMKDLAQKCGVQDIVSLYNNDGNKETVIETIKDVGSRCEPGDYFIFNYSGHGTSVPDKDGDEADGKDEALCLVTPEGKIDWDAFLTDDDFCEVVTSCVSPEVKILILCDCCHSGTIGDFSAPEWKGFEAVSMSGCRDSQTSGDTGRGGIFTHALLMAIQQMQEDQEDDYSVAQLYNMQLDKDDQVFNSKQDITVKWTSELLGVQDMAWPLLPEDNYVAPWIDVASARG